MAEYLTPGVYIEEVDTGNKPIEGVSTSTVGFLGIAERGPGAATLITSYTDYVRAFGQAGPITQSLALSSPTVAAGGAGYTNGGGSGNFAATIAGGTLAAGGAAATVQVTLTAGVVTAVSLTAGGSYSVPPASPVQIQGLTGGAGAEIGFATAPGPTQLSSPTVAAGGAGYTNGGGSGNFAATIAGGTLAAGGAAATVQVTLTAGVVTAVPLMAGGSYSVPPASPAQITGLTGGAGAEIGFATAPGPTQLSSPTVAAGGAGYTNGGGSGNFAATIAGGTLAAGGAAATVQVTLTAGVVTAVSLTAGGSYRVPPASPVQIRGLTGGAGAEIGFATAPGQTRLAYLGYAVEGFFQNGGQRCFVQTVTSGAAATANLGADPLTITAANAGYWGNRVAVKIEKGGLSTGAAVTAIKITVMYWPQTPPNTGNVVNVDPTSRLAQDLRNPDRRQPQVTEVYDNLDDNPVSPNFYGTQINGVSSLITVTQNGRGFPAIPQTPQTPPVTLLSNGSDGPTLVPADFTGDDTAQPGQMIGLAAFTEIDEISLLCCPDAYALGNNETINGALVDQCEVLQSRFAILSSLPNQQVPFTIDYNSKYAAFYYPWLNIIDPLTNQTVLIPPGGHVAGIYARSDDARGVQKDPANEVIQGIDSLQYILTDGQQALLNPVGINVLRYFKGSGNLVWGGRTTSTDPDWKYINVRRLFIFIEQSILQSTRWAVFEINDEPVWAQVRRSISDFLTRLWMDDMLQGATKDQAFFVRCDRTTMTQYDIDNGRLICVIGVAPVKPAEFVIFQIGQWAGGNSVGE